MKIRRSPEGDAYLNDVEDGTAPNISFGYRQGKPQITRNGEEVTVRWMKVVPKEVSAVPLPADETVGVGRSDDADISEGGNPPTEPAGEGGNPPAEDKTSEVRTQVTGEETRAAEVARLDAIQALGKRFGMEEIANRCALEGKSEEETRGVLLTELNKRQAASGVEEEGDRSEGTRTTRESEIIPVYSSVRSFSGATKHEAARKAYRFAKWFLAGALGNENAMRYCRDNGIKVVRSQVEGTNEAGGFLVPHEFGNDMIDLREKFGVFRRNVKVVPMISDSKSVPRRKSGLKVYVIGEGKGATESKKGWDRVGLTAKKIGVLARYSSEIAEDALVSIGDDLASEMAYAISIWEDEVGFTGNGSLDHARIIGVAPRILGLDNNVANIAGAVVASGNTFDEFVLNDFLKVTGRLPEYAEQGEVKWYCSKLFWATVMQRIKLAANGNAVPDIEAAGKRTFLGYPVEVTQTMPKTDANSQVACLFGNLRLAAMLGDRRATTIATSEHVNFEEEEFVIRATERLDINVHDVGNADATPANRTPGPMIALVSAAN